MRYLLLALVCLSCAAPQRPAPACPIVRPARSVACEDRSDQTCAYRDPDGCYMRCRCAVATAGEPYRWLCESSCGRVAE